MWKWFIGPVLLGTTAIAGSIYGRDAERLAHKSPSDTYAAVEQALDNVPRSGMTSFEGGTPVPYEVRIDRTPERELLVTVLFAGQEGAQATLDFTPQDDGNATLISARMHGDHRVLSQVLAGTSRARLAYAPDWLLNLAARPVLTEVAKEIDQGEMARFTGPTSAGEAQAQWEQNLTDEQRNNVEAWREYDATRPTVDPDAAAVNTSGSAN